MANYLHYVTDANGNVRQVYPMNFSGAAFRWQRKIDDGQVFYRVAISRALTFIQSQKEGIDDYNYFNALEKDPDRRCEQLIYEVKKDCDGAFRTFWKGTITTSKGSFDKDECTFEVKPDIYDNYTCLLAELDREVNILDDPTIITTSAFILPNYEYQVCRRPGLFTEGDMTSYSLFFCLTAPDTWEKLYYKQLRYSCDAFETVTVWAREYTFTACIGGICQAPTGTGWSVEVNDCAGSGLCRWVRKPQGFDAERFHASGYINFGSCTGSFGTIDDNPPPKEFLDITLSVPPSPIGQHNYSFPRIWGFKSGCAGRYEFKMLNYMGATNFTWSVGGTLGGTIFSGQGTDTLVIDTNVPGSLPPGGNTVIISCDIEMKPSSNTYTVTPFTLNITYGITHIGEPSLEIGELIGPDEICVAEQKVRYEYPKFHNCIGTPDFFISEVDDPGISQQLLVAGTDYAITGGGGALDGYVEINFSTDLKPGPNIPFRNKYIKLRIWIGCESSASGCLWFNECRKDFTYIKYLPNTGDIHGSEACEPSAEDCKYRVWPRDGSTFDWEVSGGTITSGHGTNEIFVNWDAGTEGCISVKENRDSCCPFLIQLSECGEDGQPPFYWCIVATTQTLSRNRWLIGAIEFMLGKAECDFPKLIQSDFFEWNAAGDAPGFVVGKNYVTGQANQMNKLTIAQKSDIIDPNASNPATRGIWTLKQAMEVLREMFQVYWAIDANGNMRLEHISYFDKAYGIDTTLPQYARDTKKLNKYDHKNPEYPKYERYAFMEAANTDFVGADIEYNNPCVTSEEDNMVLDHSADKITTDIEFIFNSPDDISKDGFVILANGDDGSGGLAVIIATGLLSTDLISNAPLSWANLHYAFHRHYRFLRNGKMNLQAETFLSFKPNLRQVPIEIPYCCEILNFDPEKKVRTELGQQHLGLIDGIIDTAEFSIKKETIRLVLLYPYV